MDFFSLLRAQEMIQKSALTFLDPIVHGAEFDVVVLAKGSLSASVHECLDCLSICHPGLSESFTFGWS